MSDAERLAALEQALADLTARVRFLERGGCTCETPQWYFANITGLYRCAKCGSVVSPRVGELRLGLSE